MSRASASRAAVPRASRQASLICSTPPNRRHGLEARVFARQAARLQTLGLAFEMELQLFAQIGFAAAAEDERSEPAADDVPGAHG